MLACSLLTKRHEQVQPYSTRNAQKLAQTRAPQLNLRRFWEALSGICSRTIPHPDSQVNRLCISPDKRFLAAAGHHTVKLFDVKSSNPNPLLTFEGHTNNITGVAFHCEGKWMVTSSEDGTVKIWDTRTATIQRNYQHGSPVNDVVIHPNQGELISCDRAGTIRVWDLGENKCAHQLIPEEDKSVASVTVASDGSMLCAGNNAVSTLVTWFPRLSGYGYAFPVAQSFCKKRTDVKRSRQYSNLLAHGRIGPQLLFLPNIPVALLRYFTGPHQSTFNIQTSY